MRGAHHAVKLRARALSSISEDHLAGFPLSTQASWKSDMGRLTKGSKRTRIQDYMKKMRNTFRAALKDDDLQEAFDELRPTWSSEMAAMIYADIIQVMDLILLTSIVDNRREIERIKQDIR